MTDLNILRLVAMVVNSYLFDSSQADDPPDGDDKVNRSESTRINSVMVNVTTFAGI